MSEVWLHIYDVTNSVSPKTNNTILGINRVFRDGIGIGGIFHGAVQVYDEEWSFGYCENGSGVFACPPKSNPMYTYRESCFIGFTASSQGTVQKILIELSKQWPGHSYDLLSRNCNHFCDELCQKLSVPKIPAWVNRFANAGDAAFEAAGTTVERLKQAKTDVAAAGKIAIRFLFGGLSRPTEQQQQVIDEGSSNGISPLRGLLSRVSSSRTHPSSSPSSSSSTDEENNNSSNASMFSLQREATAL